MEKNNASRVLGHGKRDVRIVEFMNDWVLLGIDWLKWKGIEEQYPYIENGVQKTANSMYEIYAKAIFSYQTFQIVESTTQHYSVQEQRNLKLIEQYQKEMGAYNTTFQEKRREVNEAYIDSLPHEKIRKILYIANRKNKGLYFVSGLGYFTSTTLYDNPVTTKAQGGSCGGGMPRKERVYGELSLVVSETLKLHNGSVPIFTYPYSLNAMRIQTESIYKVYQAAYKHPDSFELLEERKFYSSQHKRIIKRLKEMV